MHRPGSARPWLSVGESVVRVGDHVVRYYAAGAIYVGTEDLRTLLDPTLIVLRGRAVAS